MQIILAEDSDVTRRVFSATLEGAGHDIIAVPDGDGAWSAFRQHRPPMVILDWQMPGLDGLAVCRCIRDLPDAEDVFVLMVTSRDAASDLAEALAAGVDDYLTKPATPGHLEARVRIATRRIAQRARRRDAEDALAKSQWLAGIGHTALALQHEINNPLMALLMHARLLEEEVDGFPVFREQVSTMVALARRIDGVIRRLQELEAPKSVEYLGEARMLDLSPRGT